jgi:RecG-like helicase
MGRLRDTLDRWASQAGEDARQLRTTSLRAGCRPIEQVRDRDRVEIEGVLRTVTLRPRGGVPALEAVLYDGTGTVTLIWLGRRRIAGIEPGRAIRVEGRVGRQDGGCVMFNPRYDLRAS